ncbi:MAG: hypothetical protein KKA64_01890 [Nanoarchaeota archaeon]|nr:hypothetical protein [Nanoarchaeota archaeon]
MAEKIGGLESKLIRDTLKTISSCKLNLPSERIKFTGRGVVKETSLGITGIAFYNASENVLADLVSLSRQIVNEFPNLSLQFYCISELPKVRDGQTFYLDVKETGKYVIPKSS